MKKLAVVTRLCKNCSKEFSFKHERGRARIHCTDACRHEFRAKNIPNRPEWPKCDKACGKTVRAASSNQCNKCYIADKKAKAGVCTVRKCTAPALRSGNTMCETHYYRLRRTGSTSDPYIMGRYVTGAGYIKLLDREHPLADSNGHVTEHRKVAYDKYGDTVSCHWCGKPLTWERVCVDHLNEVKDDNRPDNLVAACNPCNRARGAMKPFISKLSDSKMSELIETFKHMRHS
jgi:hypothetical protein